MKAEIVRIEKKKVGHLGFRHSCPYRIDILIANLKTKAWTYDAAMEVIYIWIKVTAAGEMRCHELICS